MATRYTTYTSLPDAITENVTTGHDDHHENLNAWHNWVNEDRPYGGTINVKEYGAVGDGVNDDTTAIQNALSTAVANNPSTVAVFFPAGTYKVTDTLLSFNPNAEWRGLKVYGLGRRNSVINFQTTNKNAFEFNTSPTGGGNIAYLRFEGFRIDSTSNTNTAFYFWSDQNNPVQDIGFTDVGVGGTAWLRGWDFDGPETNFNHNSEIFVEQCATGQSVHFAEAAFEVRNDNDDVSADQNVNFYFINNKWEFQSGDGIKFTRGGHCHVWGGSYILIDDTHTNADTMFVLGNGTVAAGSTGPGAKVFSCIGVRFELRSNTHKLLDHYWGGGTTAGQVLFEACETYGGDYGSRYDQPLVRINGTHGETFGNIKFQNCILYGYIEVDIPTPDSSNGKVILDSCTMYSHQNPSPGLPFTGTAISTTAASDPKGAIRYTGSTAPSYRVQDCYRLTDASG